MRRSGSAASASGRVEAVDGGDRAAGRFPADRDEAAAHRCHSCAAAGVGSGARLDQRPAREPLEQGHVRVVPGRASSDRVDDAPECRRSEVLARSRAWCRAPAERAKVEDQRLAGEAAARRRARRRRSRRSRTIAPAAAARAAGGAGDRHASTVEHERRPQRTAIELRSRRRRTPDPPLRRRRHGRRRPVDSAAGATCSGACRMRRHAGCSHRSRRSRRRRRSRSEEAPQQPRCAAPRAASPPPRPLARRASRLMALLVPSVTGRAYPLHGRRSGRVGIDRHEVGAMDNWCTPARVTSLDEMTTAVLLAEPEAETRSFLQRHLSSDGFRVIEAEWDAQALDLVERACPDVVLAGELELCRRLREGLPGREVGPQRAGDRARLDRRRPGRASAGVRTWRRRRRGAAPLSRARGPDPCARPTLVGRPGRRRRGRRPGRRPPSPPRAGRTPGRPPLREGVRPRRAARAATLGGCSRRTSS